MVSYIRFFILTMILASFLSSCDDGPCTPENPCIEKDTVYLKDSVLHVDTITTFDTTLVYDTIVTTEFDTIIVRDTCSGVVYKEFFERYSMVFPCDYSFRYGFGDDTRSFEATFSEDGRSYIVDINSELPYGPNLDTVYTVPDDNYLGIYPNKVVIANESNNEVGIFFYGDINTTNIDRSGNFLVREGEVYFDILFVNYKIHKEEEVFDILSTLKMITE